MARSFGSVAKLIIQIVGIDSTFQAALLSVLNRYVDRMNRLVGLAPEEHLRRAMAINSDAFDKLSDLCFELYPEIDKPSLEDIPNKLVSIISNLTPDEAYELRLKEHSKLWEGASAESLIERRDQQENNIRGDAENIVSISAEIQSMASDDMQTLQKKLLKLEILEKRSKLSEAVILKCEDLLRAKTA